MKKLLVIVVSALCFIACQNGDKMSPEQKAKALKDSANFTTIEWLDSLHQDLGTVKEGPKVPIVFRLKNTGSHVLIISDVAPSCGCTIVEKPEKPIAPGQEYAIKAEFTTDGHVGENHKDIMVTSNTFPEKFTRLTFHVVVTK